MLWLRVFVVGVTVLGLGCSQRSNASAAPAQGLKYARGVKDLADPHVMQTEVGVITYGSTGSESGRNLLLDYGIQVTHAKLPPHCTVAVSFELVDAGGTCYRDGLIQADASPDPLSGKVPFIYCGDIFQLVVHADTVKRSNMKMRQVVPGDYKIKAVVSFYDNEQQKSVATVHLEGLEIKVSDSYAL